MENLKPAEAVHDVTADCLRFSLVPFRVAPVAAGPAAEDVEFYSSIVTAVFDLPTTFLQGEAQHPPIAYGVAQANERSNQFVQGLHKAMNLERPAGDVIVLDLRDFLRCRGAVQALVGDQLLDEIGRLEGERLLLVMDWLPADGGSFMAGLATETLSGDLVVIGLNDGRTSLNDDAATSRLRPIAAGLSQDPIEGLRDKLICAPGWFRRQQEEGGVVYSRRHYDGSLCAEELYDLLSHHLAVNAPTAVLLYSPESDWLHEPLRYATEISGTAYFDFRITSLEDALSGLAASDRLLIVTPMAHSGHSLQRLRKVVRDAGYSGDVIALSILSTSGPRLVHGQRPIGRELILDYFLKVDQNVVSSEDPRCYVTLMSQPESVFDLRASHLSAYEFWDLVDQAGTKDEEDIPPHRVSDAEHLQVPDVPGMVALYGVWLAHRLINLIRATTRLGPPQFVLVCPAEHGAEAVAAHIQHLFQVPVLRVPRASLSLSDTELTSVIDKNEDDENWIAELKSASGLPVVLFDEFTTSGGTIASLARACKYAGLHVALGAVILDFTPIDYQADLRLEWSSVSGSPTGAS